ncbi:MAG: hypothetical protein NVV74_07830 [Magnetospirillum sp.]|nr:hypothetical protein [Magnetospirillum sp.]
MTEPVRPDTNSLLAELAAARGEVAEAAAKSRALRKQMLAEGLVQSAQEAQRRGDTAQAAALADEVAELQHQALDMKV